MNGLVWRSLSILLILLLATGCLRPEVWRAEVQIPATVQPSIPATRPTGTSAPQIVESSPKPVIYIVQPGDTLSEIAARFGTTVAELVALNSNRYPSLKGNPSLIHVGWELHLPKIALQMPVETPLPSPAVRVFDAKEAEEQIVSLVNQARAQRGLGSLATEPLLVDIARQRSEDMRVRNYFSHYDPETGEVMAKKLFAQRGYTNYIAAENIGLVRNEEGFVPAQLTVVACYGAHEIAQRLVEGWLESPKHRENILNADFSKTGVGVAVSSIGKRIIVTQIFLGE